MTAVAISMVKDEADIIGRVVRHLLAEHVDHVIVADNLSSDQSAWILDRLAVDTGRVTVLEDPDPAHYQGRKMTALARMAGDLGAEWVVPFDADEVWYSPTGPLGTVLANSVNDVEVADVWFQIGDFRERDVKVWPKVAFRYRPDVQIAEGNHSVVPQGVTGRGLLKIRELQYRSLEQMTRKVRNGKAAMEATDLPDWQGAHWRQLGALSDCELAVEWGRLQASVSVWDPVPWST